MSCHGNERDRKWSCTWCQLRICRSCSEELCRVRGRSLERVVEERRMREGEKGVEEEYEMDGETVRGEDEVS